MCRSRRELSNAYLLAKFRFDTAENEPSKSLPDRTGRRSRRASAPSDLQLAAEARAVELREQDLEGRLEALQDQALRVLQETCVI